MDVKKQMDCFYACGGPLAETNRKAYEQSETVPAEGSVATTDAAKRAVAAVMRELRGRKGFSWWWNDVRDEDQEDIIKCAEAEVARVL